VSRDHRLFNAQRIKESNHIADEMEQSVLVDSLQAAGEQHFIDSKWY
jgi:hypothetical protein